MRITVDADIDLEKIVIDYKADVINILECDRCYVLPYSSLVDRYKIEWFKEAMDKYSLEEFEEKFPV